MSKSRKHVISSTAPQDMLTKFFNLKSDDYTDL